MINAQGVAKRVLNQVDNRYQRTHQLLPVGPLLLIGRTRYEGPNKRFPDGTELQFGDPMGELHFNNARLNQLQANNATSAGFGFARLMFASLRRLALQTDSHPMLADLEVYHGVTWLRPHGGSVGFASEPLAPGFSRRWKTAYFRILLWAFESHQSRHETALDPHHYWLTRHLLHEKFHARTTNSLTSTQSVRLHRATPDNPRPTWP